MNVFTIISFLLSMAVFGAGLYMSSPELHIFIDYTSMFIVIGGSMTATAFSFKLEKLFTMTKIFLGRVIKGKGIKLNAVVTELVKSIDEIKKGKKLTEIAESTNDLFFKESLELINDGLLNPEDLLEVLEMRNEKIAEIYKRDCDQMKAIGKFPPAFGMIGTTIGMIVLLANLGGEDAMKKIGPAMGVCLITTMYGASIANIIINPMAENLTENTKEVYAKNEIIIEGIKLILTKSNPILAAERLNSYLTPSERVDWKQIIGA